MICSSHVSIHPLVPEQAFLLEQYREKTPVWTSLLREGEFSLRHEDSPLLMSFVCVRAEQFPTAAEGGFQVYLCR